MERVKMKIASRALCMGGGLFMHYFFRWISGNRVFGGTFPWSLPSTQKCMGGVMDEKVSGENFEFLKFVDNVTVS